MAHSLHQSVILGGFIFIHTDFIENSFSKGVKPHLNSDPLSENSLFLHGYMRSHVFLNIRLTLGDYLSMYSLFTAEPS